MLVIGGFYSVGGKLGFDENSLDGLYFKVFQKWWNEIFGSFVKFFLNVIVLIIGGMGSFFYVFCYRIFVFEGMSFDIMLIEMLVNDKGLVMVKLLE